ncbi:uncharacterized protein LOC111035695 [Myzus persicae]|uniref:uncharacterized protein LOC111035695 n=1 Tax=Myzus persicae TaxID=13164 RepID=UPI000B92FF0D|nr:uncharacterized protein LOC111035695 [Myzus persicae]
MSVRSILNTFNQFFLIWGLGSISYNQSKLNTAIMFSILRCTTIFCGLKTIYDSNRHWIIHIDPNLFDVTSLVMISCYEMMIIGRFLCNGWRLFYDNKLSVILIKLEGIHDKLIRLKALRIGSHWLFNFGILVHFICYNMSPLYYMIYKSERIRQKTVDFYISLISVVISRICECVAFYEYMLLISYIKWIVYIINEQIPKIISTISTFRDLYLEAIECLKDINRSIYGLPVIMSCIAGNVGSIILSLFYRFLFTEDDTVDVARVIMEADTIIIKMINIILLYGIGHATAKEINRMSLVLHQRSIIERNPRIKRQIKFFILRRHHEDYHFVLYGICEINLQQLLVLANKAIAYLVIQILFKLNKNKIID